MESCRPRRRVLSEPKQQRSQRTLDRILEAAEKLIDGRDFSHVSVQEISDAAGTSVSSFYARFPDKDAVLHALMDRITDRIYAEVDERARPERWEGRTLRDMVEEAVALYTEFWRDHGGLIRTVKLAEQHDPSLLEKHRALEKGVMVRIHRVAERLDPKLAASSSRAMDMAMGSLGAGVRSAVERPESFESTSDAADRDLMAELIEMGMRYLKADG